MKGSYEYKHIWKTWKHLVFMKINVVYLKLTNRTSANIQMVCFIATEISNSIYIKLKESKIFTSILNKNEVVSILHLTLYIP